eukprot:c16086_g1_i1 orf=310-603(+)
MAHERAHTNTTHISSTHARQESTNCRKKRTHSWVLPARGNVLDHWLRDNSTIQDRLQLGSTLKLHGLLWVLSWLTNKLTETQLTSQAHSLDKNQRFV